jgi:hypothetical protein
MDTGGTEAHRTDSCLAFLWNLALVGTGAGRSALAPIPAFVFGRVGGNVFRIGAPGTRIGVAVALLRRGSGTLFLFSSGCHNISNRHPSIKATDVPFAEALM